MLKRALEQCGQERRREGNALGNELIRLLNALRDIIDEMEPLAAANQDHARQQIIERWEKLKIPDVDDSRLAQEVVVFLDRCDVTEEIIRLREHIIASSALLKSPAIMGKKLEFFCQELLREVNTIGSKSQKVELTHYVVEAKGCIERLREQVQNVE